MKTRLSPIKSMFILILSCSLSAMAQSDFTKETADITKIKVRQDFPLEGRPSKNGTGWSTNVSLLPEMPKRVALVTFYLEDPGMSDQKNTSGTTTSSLWATDEGTGGLHVNGFYNASIDELKAGFEKMGMELLTPDQYLDSDAKKEFYNSFVPEHGGLKKEKTTTTRYTEAGTLQISRPRPTPPGFKTMWISNEWANVLTAIEQFISTNKNDAKFFESMGYYLAEGLGVDAVAAVTIVTRKLEKDKATYGVNHVNLYMWTKNPIQLSEEEDTGMKGLFYIRGQFLAGARVTYEKTSLFQLDQKKKGYGPEYDGMGNVMTALTDNINEYFVKKRKE